MVRMALLGVWGCSLMAQGVATIYGTVTDPGGAVIPGVKVAVTNAGTGTVRSVETDAAGNYVVVQLPVGNYTVMAQAAGFKEFVQSDVQLQVSDNRRVDVAMQVGQVTERVEVQAAVTQVETRTGTIAEVIDSHRIVDLPLNGRNPVQLQSLVAGVGRRGGRDQQQNETISVNGSAFRGNNYALDGGDNHDPFFNTPAPFPNPDALQEFSIETNAYGADKGRNAGIFVSAVTRSGTNRFHGGLFEFLRNNKLNTRDFFALRVPPFKRNQYGGTLGGPVRRDRTFFFVSWQATKERSAPGVTTALVLTEAQRRGDFSAMTRALTDPDAGRPFPGNLIPASRLYGPSQRFLETYIPLPNQPGGFLSFAAGDGIDDEQRIAKVDHNWSPANRMSARLLWNFNDTRQSVGTIPQLLASIVYTNWNGTWADTHVFSPTTVNHLSVTMQNIKRIQNSIAPQGKTWTDLGAGVVRAHRENTTTAVSTNVVGYFNAFTRYPLFQERFYMNIDDEVNLTRGAHLIKFGGELRFETVDRVERFQGDAALTFRGNLSGDAAADLLLGRVSLINQNSGAESYPRGSAYSLFFQDDWKISRRLTVNLGLRWDPYVPPPDTRGTGAMFRAGRQSTYFPLAPSGLVYWGQDASVPLKYGFGNQWKNFAPRAGFAWDPFGNGRSSVRGGYGIFYASRALQMIGGGGPGYVLTLTLDPVPGGLADPYRAVGGNPYPFDAPSSAAERAAFRFVRPVSTGSWEEGWRNGIVQQWNFSLQREVAPGYIATLAYVAGKGNHMESTREINPGIFGRPGNLQQRRRFPDFSSLGSITADGNYTYNSFQASLNKRLSSGFTLLASYTWARTIDSAPPIDGLDHSREKAVSANNLDHRFIGSFIWQLPRLTGREPWLRGLLGGWEVNGIVELESGLYLNVVSGRDNSGTGINNDRPDLVGNPHLDKGRARSDRIGRWFNPAAFQQNAAGTFGAAGRNLIEGPGSASVDFGLVKNITLREAHRLQVRGEAFNLLNRVNLDNPNGNLTSPAVGRITSAGPPRVLQVALKWVF